MNDGWEDNEEEGEDEPKQWLSMQDAVDLLAVANSLSRAAAKDSILDLISDARLKLRCQRRFNPPDVNNIVWRPPSKWVLVPRSYTEKEKTAFAKSSRERRSQQIPPIEKRFQPRSLPADYWQKRDGWNIEASKIDWVSSSVVGVKSVQAGGNPSANTSSNGVICRAANGVEIMRDLAIFPLTPSEQMQARAPKPKGSNAEKAPRSPGERGRSGPRPKVYNFAPILLELESKIQSNEMYEFGRLEDVGVQAVIERYISGKFDSDNSPSESTIRRNAVKIMRIWREYSKGR